MEMGNGAIYKIKAICLAKGFPEINTSLRKERMNRILIVEDNKEISFLLNKNLSRNPDYHILCTYDGVSALRTVPRFQPDLILLDGQLPHLTGDKVASQLRQNPTTSQIPILSITGEPYHSSIATTLRSLCDQSLAKPFCFTDLHTHIENLLPPTPA